MTTRSLSGLLAYGLTGSPDRIFRLGLGALPEAMQRLTPEQQSLFKGIAEEQFCVWESTEFLREPEQSEGPSGGRPARTISRPEKWWMGGRKEVAKALLARIATINASSTKTSGPLPRVGPDSPTGPRGVLRLPMPFL